MPLTRGGRREVAGGPRPARAEGPVDGVLGTRSRDPRGRRRRGQGRTPGHLAGVPATRAGIRPRRPVRTERGATPGVSARRKLVPGRLDSRLPLNTPAACFQGRPREGRISGTAAAAPGGRGGGGGRLARRLGERPGGPGLSPPQPPPLLAGGTRSGHARRGRKLSDLVGKHQNKRPSGAGARPPQLSPSST